MTTEQVTMYKVVRKNLTSIVVTGKAKTTYSTKRYTAAPKFLRDAGYGPTVFDTISHARSAATKFFWDGGIWEVQCREVTLPKHTLLIPSLEEGVMSRTPFGCEWPEGTTMAESVRLVKKVHTVGL